MRLPGILAGALLAGAVPTLAIWSPRGTPVPVDRVLANVEKQVKDHPNDSAAWLVLGRLRSYAFFSGSQQVPMSGERLFVPNIPEKGRASEPSPKDLEHLKQSMLAFRKSISLDAKPALPYLGLAWDLEQGAKFVERLGKPPGEEGGHATSPYWIDRALTMYRQAYDRASKDELAMKFFAPGYEAISQEAAQRIVAIESERLKNEKKEDHAKRAEIEKLEQNIAKLRRVPRAVTPVIFSFREGTALRDLVAPEVHVDFDLDGFGGTGWTWLKPTTGILVWDPSRTGSITSGLQLFGSVTWWMFWQDGYRALAALDDNSDGWLSGDELTGIAVWIDRNQNGRSDRGEVVSLGDAGIARIRVSGKPGTNGTLGHPQGIEFSDGRRTPSYDWIAENAGSNGPTSFTQARGNIVPCALP